MAYLYTGSCLIFGGSITASSKVPVETETVQNRITILPDTPKVQYNKMIFGQFIEHFDNQIYGGIFDPGSKYSDADGFRTDVIEALKEIKTPIVR